MAIKNVVSSIGFGAPTWLVTQGLGGTDVFAENPAYGPTPKAGVSMAVTPPKAGGIPVNRPRRD